MENIIDIDVHAVNKLSAAAAFCLPISQQHFHFEKSNKNLEEQLNHTAVICSQVQFVAQSCNHT